MRAWGWAALLVAWGAAAAAGPVEDAVVAQLARQGYASFEVSRTWLGRVRVVATAPDGRRREIVVNPATGEVLRDYVAGAAGVPDLLSWDGRSGSGGGGGGGDRGGDDDRDDDGDRDDEDRDDDDGDDDDRSGHGGGDDDDREDDGGDDD